MKSLKEKTDKEYQEKVDDYNNNFNNKYLQNVVNEVKRINRIR